MYRRLTKGCDLLCLRRAGAALAKLTTSVRDSGCLSHYINAYMIVERQDVLCGITYMAEPLS